MTEIPDDEVEAFAHVLHDEFVYSGVNRSKHWQVCADIYREHARRVLAAVRPRWEKQLAELRSERDDAGLRWGEHYSAKLAAVEAEMAAARAELERVREHADLMRQALQEVADALRLVPEQGQP